MQKVNYDAKRAAVLKQIHDDKVKAKRKAEADAKKAANQAPVIDDQVAEPVVVNQQAA